MIDMDKESMLSMEDVIQLLPNHPSYVTLYRWFTTGLKGTVLETVKVGRKRYTSKEAVQRFIEALTASHTTS